MAQCIIKGVPVRFPFEPYDIQKNYMEKVLECLQNKENGVLESPTGTGKTLSLLCSSLAWLEVKKAQVQAQRTAAYTGEDGGEFLKNLEKELEASGGKGQSGRAFLGMPTIIYASRTHSQLSQAMQELKRTQYNYMKACVLGSREQMCIHSDIARETNNSAKIHMCRLKVKEKSCHYYNRVERKKDDPTIAAMSVVDIEDIVKLGETHKFCPYYMSKELKQKADIIFMPYNYLLDPKARKALGVELNGNVIILDEAHNIEKICEDSASLQIRSTDITLCIEEVTAVMKAISEDIPADFNDHEVPNDFTPDELIALKQMFLDFEKVLDEVPLTNAEEGTTFDGSYIFEMLEKASINDGNYNAVIVLLEKLVQFLSTVNINDGPFQRKGNALQLFSDLLIIAFNSVSSEFKEKIRKCYKVHLVVEEPKKKNADNWLTKVSTKARCRVLSYWCFSPGFGMNMLMGTGVHCVILTSGTLAPLRPLISELEINVGVRIENPHIVTGDQVCVKILTKGPDMEPLNCNYQNRNNPRYIQSLGTVILNLVRIIPHGVLIFFPSYPIMQKCQQSWQDSGTWAGINQIKPIYVEPKEKNAFNTAMSEYYAKIQDPVYKGAIFFGVCRGKVSEGLDFADINGRAVLITGLPYPPLKDPRIVLKKRYLDRCNAADKEYLRGDDWYSLEATRAVNQAIGRVIRHRNDYGAIILLDERFTNMRIRNNMSKWLQKHIKVVQSFGEIVRDLRSFFKNAGDTLPAPVMKSDRVQSVPATFDIPQTRKGNFDFSSSSLPSTSSVTPLVTLHKRKTEDLGNVSKRKKLVVMPNKAATSSNVASIKEFIVMVKKALDEAAFKVFVTAMAVYRGNHDLEELIGKLDEIFLNRHDIRYIIHGISPFIREDQKEEFGQYSKKMQ